MFDLKKSQHVCIAPLLKSTIQQLGVFSLVVGRRHVVQVQLWPHYHHLLRRSEDRFRTGFVIGNSFAGFDGKLKFITNEHVFRFALRYEFLY